DNLVGNASLTYKIINGLKLTATVRKNTNTNLYEFIVPTEIETSGSQTGDLASYSTGQLKVDNWGYDAIASYTHGFDNDRLNLNLNAGASDQRNSNYTAEMATKNG